MRKRCHVLFEWPLSSEISNSSSILKLCTRNPANIKFVGELDVPDAKRECWLTGKWVKLGFV